MSIFDWFDDVRKYIKLGNLLSLVVIFLSLVSIFGGLIIVAVVFIIGTEQTSIIHLTLEAIALEVIGIIGLVMYWRERTI